jgi:hypothetical protein
VPPDHARDRSLGDSAAIHSCEDRLGLAEVGSVCLVVWQGEVTKARFIRQRAALESVVARYPRRAGMICAIDHTTPPPDEQMRRATTDMIENLGDRLGFIMCVIEGSGFRAAMTRSILSGMALVLRRNKTQIKFTALIQEAAAWAEPKSMDIAPGALKQMYEQLRARLVEQAARGTK